MFEQWVVTNVLKGFWSNRALWGTLLTSYTLEGGYRSAVPLTALLIWPSRFVSSPPSSGCRLWHSEEWHRYCSHVRDEAGAHHEVHHPRGHGGYHSHLRPGGGSAHRQQHLRKTPTLQVSLLCMLSHFLLNVQDAFLQKGTIKMNLT